VRADKICFRGLESKFVADARDRKVVHFVVSEEGFTWLEK
jgi:hypothetical protein